MRTASPSSSSSRRPTRRWPFPTGPTSWSTAATAAPAPPRPWPPTRRSEGSFSAPDIGLVFYRPVVSRGSPMSKTTRRALIKGAAAAAAAGALPIRATAQGEPLKFGILTPLTGAGGQDGPRMLKAMQAVIDEVNKGGGVLGRKIETIVEDDQ